MELRLLLMIPLSLCLSQTVRGDLNQYMVRTTEWLVEHSDVICVAEFKDEHSKSILKIHATLKGDEKTIRESLNKPEQDGAYYFGPISWGKLRLLFIGENQVLWQSVKLKKFTSSAPTLTEAFYGVDQFGNLHLTESALFAAIQNQLAVGPSKPVSRRRSTFSARSGIVAPPYFPFKCGDETFVLIVDFTERRRDYYRTQLKEGNLAERLHAIGELSQLEDPLARDAIQAATKVTEVEPSFAFDYTDQPTTEQAAAAVRKAALKVLDASK